MSGVPSKGLSIDDFGNSRFYLTDPHNVDNYPFRQYSDPVTDVELRPKPVAHKILKRGAHPDDRDGLTDMTLIQYACKAGTAGIGNVFEACELAHLLIDKGCNVSFRCRWTSMIALHYAAYFDVALMIKILLSASKGIDIDLPSDDFDSGTSLHISTSQKNIEAAKALLQGGANPHLTDKNNKTAMDCISEGNEGRELMDLLNLASSHFQKPHYDTPTYEGIMGKVLLMQLGFKLGDRVVVNEMEGVLRYMGTTEFAKGCWAGVELDEEEGKNNGTVSNVTYFRCPEKKGGVNAEKTYV